MINIIKLKFKTPIHIGNFGKPGIEKTDAYFCSDTLYSALFYSFPAHIDELLGYINKNELLISDALPFVGNELLVFKQPSSFVFGNSTVEIDRSIFKKMKKLTYVPSSKYVKLYKGCDISDIEDCLTLSSNIGTEEIRTFNTISRVQSNSSSTTPVSLATFTFDINSGLYVVINSTDKVFSLILNLFKELGLIGIGGRRSAGLGKFDVEVLESIPDFFNNQSGKKILLLSTFLPTDYNKLNNNNFNVIKRSGFYQSSIDNNLYKKKDIYAIKSGSVFDSEIKGSVLDNLSSKSEKVYRVLLPLYIKVDL
ncbi:MAG: type III-A CRISPR-associated RAMP protein Csm4 [Acholeplasmatales bacterium]|jgi:CRISPR-associated protein Csm4|nr:type III-A CRISPR-associated RAMP protein Csm4 [Acholeplasmatales bacterium]